MRIALVVAALALVLAGCAPDAPAATNPPVAADSPSPTPSQTAAPTTSHTVADASSFTARNPADFAWIDSPGSGVGPSLGVHFVSPSTNLGCAIVPEGDPGFGGQWGCAAAEFDFTFPDDSPDDYCYGAEVPCGGGIEVTGDELPHPRYRGDPGFPAAMSIYNDNAAPYHVEVLQYEESVTLGDVTCYSEERGITCENAVSGHGFIIARDLNTIF